MTGNLFDAPSSPPPAWFTAHCDGGSRGNPGPSGYGAVIEDPRGQTVARLSQFLGVQTNNFAEYSGLIAVLKWANENDAKHLKVVSDSELMVNQMKGRYKVGSPTLRPLWEDARRLAARLDRFEISHTLRGGNKEADHLANEAMDKGWKAAKSGSSGVSAAGGVRANAYERPPEPRVPPVPRTSGTETVQPPNTPRQVLDGYVKDGVVHLLNGELPEGAFVKVTKE